MMVMKFTFDAQSKALISLVMAYLSNAKVQGQSPIKINIPYRVRLEQST